MDNHLVPLPPGVLAPDFTLRHTPRLTMSLRRLARDPIVLVFYPVAFEPVSREQLALYQEYLPRFEAFDAKLLGISADHV
jgi:peroxiredoxin